MKVEVLATQSCLTLCDPMNCSPPGFTVHGVLQTRILEWIAIPFLTQGLNPGLLHCRQILYHLSHREVHRSTFVILSAVQINHHNWFLGDWKGQMYSVRKKGYAIQYIIVYKINISFNISLFTKLIFNKSMNMNILRNHYIVESICSFVQELINRSIIINKKPRPGYIPHV